MLEKVRITAGWMLSPTAQRVYLISAICSVFCFCLAVLVPVATQLDMLPNRLLLAVAFRVVVLPAIIGTAILWVAMLYYWLGFDQSHWAMKALWFIPLLLMVPFGPILYYFVVYRRRH